MKAKCGAGKGCAEGVRLDGTAKVALRCFAAAYKVCVTCGLKAFLG